MRHAERYAWVVSWSRPPPPPFESSHRAVAGAWHQWGARGFRWIARCLSLLTIAIGLSGYCGVGQISASFTMVMAKAMGKVNRSADMQKLTLAC